MNSLHTMMDSYQLIIAVLSGDPGISQLPAAYVFVCVCVCEMNPPQGPLAMKTLKKYHEHRST